ncbi:MAG: hypothetical protein ABSF22_14780, partial [Bryobacteraceae bacterium]
MRKFLFVSDSELERFAAHCQVQIVGGVMNGIPYGFGIEALEPEMQKASLPGPEFEAQMKKLQAQLA